MALDSAGVEHCAIQDTRSEDTRFESQAFAPEHRTSPTKSDLLADHGNCAIRAIRGRAIGCERRRQRIQPAKADGEVEIAAPDVLAAKVVAVAGQPLGELATVDANEIAIALDGLLERVNDFDRPALSTPTTFAARLLAT